MLHKRLTLVAIVIIAVFSSFKLVEDSDFLKELRNKLADYNKSHRQEKVYLQLDKPFYKPGEDIWFNAFVLDGNTHRPTTISDVLYVHLIDPKGQTITKLKLSVQAGTTHGDFKLGINAPGGIYKIKAYTRWMKNFGKENLFKKDIQVQQIITPRLLLDLDYEKEAYGPGDEVKAKLSIVDLKNQKASGADVSFTVKLKGKNILSSKIHSEEDGKANITFTLPRNLDTKDGLLQVLVNHKGVEESISRAIPIVLDKISLQFFPEGGQYVSKVSSKIGFKALNEFGKGADVKGNILDQDGNIVTPFESFHMGMGAFEFTPEMSKKYFARIEVPAGNNNLIALPSALKEGMSMQLSKVDNSSVTWSIYSSQESEVHLVGRTHGKMTYAKDILLNAGMNKVNLSTAELPTGITIFTLFDQFGTEQCERLVFLNANNDLNINLETDKESYQPGEEVQLKVTTTDGNSNPVQTKLSLAVVDDQLISFADDKQDNLLSSLLLSSEVRGEIQEPSFYFDKKEEKAVAALDYLLMTQGWRGFKWSDIEANKPLIVHSPEKVQNISGQTVNANGIGESAEVFLIEIDNLQRMEKVKSTRNGYFMFKKVDPTVPVMLLTKKPHKINLSQQKSETFSILLNDKSGTTLSKETLRKAMTNKTSEVSLSDNEVIVDEDFDLDLTADVSQLSEIVVVSCGSVVKRSIVGSVVSIKNDELEPLASISTIENALQSRVAGISVESQSGAPGNLSNITIRGSSSLGNGNSSPLYVVDGVPVGTSLNKNFSNSSIVGVKDIESIEVLSSPFATAIYGSRGGNGVILISTKSGRINRLRRWPRRKGKYNVQHVKPRSFSKTREFYVPPVTKAFGNDRENFNSTVYWNHTVTTNKEGVAKLTFTNNEAVSSFRMTAEGFTAKGLVGRKEEVYFTTLPVSLDAKLPEYLGFEDTLKLPVRITNETTSSLKGKIILDIPSGISLGESKESVISVPKNSTKTFWFTIIPKGISGEFPINIKFESSVYQDEIKHMFKVKPVGFPVHLSFSAREIDQTVKFNIQEAEAGTIKAEFSAFPNLLDDLFTGVESILREPHGCFEQVSSSTFPNILALQYLQETGQAAPGVEKLALDYIEKGYKKLMSYEIKQGGFEWFGKPPGHEGLSAFGLIEFYEMKKVFPKVEASVIERTQKWLLSRRNGKGGFKQHRGKYGFSGASTIVNNAYITYALSETGYTDIPSEYQHAYQEAIDSKDMYRMGVMANAAINLKQMDDYQKLVDIFLDQYTNTGLKGMAIDHSIVRSYGKSLQCETLSFWTLALLKSENIGIKVIEKCINEILSMRSYGRFGSTQATTMALKALTEYAKLVKSSKDDGKIEIQINKQLIKTIPYYGDAKGKIVVNDFASSFNSNGEQSLRILIDGTKEAIPYSMDMSWFTKRPSSDERCKVALQTSLGSKDMKVNETVRLNVKLRNKTAAGLPMTVAVVGIPAGLSLQPWQLKELQEKEIFDFYEIIDNKLVIYYREMAPKGQLEVNLDLKAEVSGKFTAAASSAYLYYTEEFKDWEKGEQITIN